MKLTIKANEANFKSEVLDATQPVLVEFWSGKSSLGEMLATPLEEIASDQSGRVKIVTVNVDENPILARLHHIRSIPTLMYYVDGQIWDQITGPASKSEIEAKLENYFAAKSLKQALKRVPSRN